MSYSNITHALRLAFSQEHQTARRMGTPLLTFLLLLLPLTATAQDQCATIGQNPQWTDGLKQLVSTMQANDMQSAKLQAKELADICPNAPMLNYLQGKIAEALGETQDALYYYQKASENTYTFAVDPDNAKKIWYARYETEHPERTASALTSSNEKLQAIETELAQSQSDNAKLLDNIHTLEASELKTSKTLMWTGVGSAAGGLALVGAGVGLIFSGTKYEKVANGEITVTTKDSNNILVIDETKINKYTYTTNYTTGWMMIGIGSAFTVAGTILTAIYGYKYTHSKSEQFSFQVSPFGSATLIYKF